MKTKYKVLIIITVIAICVGRPVHEYIKSDCPNTAGVFVRCI